MGFGGFAWGLALASCLLAAPAWAVSDKPSFGPPPAWVDQAPIADLAAPEGSPAVQLLLDDNQNRLGPTGDVFYTRRVLKVLKSEGLSGLTTRSFTWDPDTESLAVHTIAIRRGDKMIDLLKGGKSLLVLRREQGLETGMLDGRLTATMQIEGLQVGDLLDVAWTVSKRDPVTRGRSEDPEALSSGVTGRFRVRASWPSTDPVRWRVTDGLPQPVTTTRDGRSELLLDVTQVKAPIFPAGAPARYRWIGRLYGSSYASWNEVSEQISPLFEQAAALGAASPLRAQAQAIAAKSADPKARAFEALRLVEDKIRYFYVGTNDGGYVPAAADETWRRLFGDCKGKTVVLLALLRQLGIKAEPALVSTAWGDGLDQELPGLMRFDHVLVRAEIGGRTYWLDGTRQGDLGGGDEQAPPAWRWALPLRPGGAGLERIVQPPMEKPMIDVQIRLDASKGLDAPAAATFRIISHGDLAVGMRLRAARASKEDLIRLTKQSLSNSLSWLQPKSVVFRDDPQTNAFEIDITGDADLDWRENRDLHVREFKIPSSNTAAKLFPSREAGFGQDAPFAIPFPMYIKAGFEVVLPDGGHNFSIIGPSRDQTLGQYRVVDTVGLTGDLAHFEGSVRTLKPEVSATEATAANQALRHLDDDNPTIRLWPNARAMQAAALARSGS